jgi:puromycin-sensitive aminopeptidase
MKRNRIFSLRRLTIALACLSLGTTGNAMVASVGDKPVVRLAPGIRPEKYQLKLVPDLKSAKFTGSETIDLALAEKLNAGSPIRLNANDLQVRQAAIVDNGQTLPAQVTPDAANEAVLLRLAKPIEAGKHKLRLEFSGNLNDKLVGFYKSTFKDDAGKEHVLAATQMEPTDARRMFPCFDEPDFKAKFKLEVDVPAGLVAISNGAVEKETKTAAFTRFQFVETPPMSTYLVALVVGDFEPTAEVVSDGVPIKVWAIKGRKDMGIYARDMAARLLPYYNEYFKIPYPWQKLDLIAVPDFEAGAMENPGAITFRETLLLLDPKTGSAQSRRSITSVIAHEMAHLWFGDLVTMKWWDDLWLNEAFATWMSTRAVDHVVPEWEFSKHYAGDRAEAMHTDSLLSTRSIHADVKNPAQANEMFDTITYSKGAAILRMCESYVGDEVFRQGVHDYLSTHSYKNATTEDLWSAVGQASHLPITEMMHGWVYQPGFPLVSLISASQKEGQSDGLSLEQKRFILAETDKKLPQTWSVPVIIKQYGAGDNSADIKMMMKPEESITAVAGVTKSETINANAGGVGYYRVKYPKPMLDELLSHLDKLTAPERIALLSDEGALLQAGQSTPAEYLGALSYFREQTDESLWHQELGQLRGLEPFVDEGNRPAFERFVQYQLGSIAPRLGWQAGKDDSQQKRILRGSVIEMLGTIGGDQAIIDEAHKRFKQYLTDENSLDPDLVEAVSSIIAYNGTASDFDTFKKLYETAKTPEKTVRNLMMLGQFAEKPLVQKALLMSIDGSVRTQDAPHLLGGILWDHRSNDAAWEFIKTHWSKITSLYSQQMVPRVIAGAGSFITPAMFTQLRDFFATHKIVAGESTVKRTLERVSINAAFDQRSAGALNDWLKEHYGKGGGELHKS